MYKTNIQKYFYLYVVIDCIEVLKNALLIIQRDQIAFFLLHVYPPLLLYNVNFTIQKYWYPQTTYRTSEIKLFFHFLKST